MEAKARRHEFGMSVILDGSVSLDDLAKEEDIQTDLKDFGDSTSRGAFEIKFLEGVSKSPAYVVREKDQFYLYIDLVGQEMLRTDRVIRSSYNRKSLSVHHMDLTF